MNRGECSGSRVATLSAIGTIPVASVALVLGIHRPMSQALTPTDLLGNALGIIAIAKWETALDLDRVKRMPRWRGDSSVFADGPSRRHYRNSTAIG